MKLKGIVTIKLTDSDGIIREEITQENLIPDNSWLQLLGSNAARGFFVRRISISQDTSTPIASNFTITQVIATAYAPTGVTTPFWNETVEPIYGQIIGRIDPVGVSRIFNSVALTNLGSGSVQNTSAIAYAWLKLDLPCTQLENDFVNITYSIQFIDDIGDGFINKNLVRFDFGRCMFGQGDFLMMNLYASLYGIVQGEDRKIAIVGNQIGFVDKFGATPYAFQTRVDSHFKWKYRLPKGRETNNPSIGTIFNSLLQGTSNDGLKMYAASKFNYDKEPFQTGFFHGQNSTIPFFDVNNLANSQGLIYLSGTWQGKFPELYKINITMSGDATTAQYKFSVLKHLGFTNNTMAIPDSITPYRNFNFSYVIKLHGWREVDFDVHRFTNTQIVQYDDTGVSLVDLFDGNNQTWDSTTTPELPVVTVRQIAIDTVNKKIYVACRVNGLWVIDPVANTVTNIFAVACYGVDIGRNNIVFAIISSGFYSSTDWSVPIVLSFTGLSDANWSRTKYLKVDPEHSNDRMAIIADNGSGTIRIIWYEKSTNTATLGYQNNNIPVYCAGLDVSDTGSTWVFFRVSANDNILVFDKLLFNGTSINSSFSGFGRGLNLPQYYGLNGSNPYLYAKITFYQDSAFGGSSFIGGAFVFDYNDMPSSVSKFSLNTYALHLDNGIILINNFLRQIFSNNALAYISYGWDGSQWIKDNAGSKLCHTTDQTLLNGLLIRFQNGTNAPHFVLNEYFTQSVNYGLLKDNATDLEINTQWYSKSIYYADISVTIPGTATITLPAASETYFRLIETDDTSLHSFSIADVPVTKIYTDATAPMVSEIRLQSNGVVAFNSADIGKLFSGKYLWISS